MFPFLGIFQGTGMSKLVIENIMKIFVYIMYMVSSSDFSLYHLSGKNFHYSSRQLGF